MVTGQLVNVAGGAAAALAVSLALMSTLLIVLVIVIVANRAEPDPRPAAAHRLPLRNELRDAPALLRRVAPHRDGAVLSHCPALRAHGQPSSVAIIITTNIIIIGALLAALFVVLPVSV